MAVQVVGIILLLLLDCFLELVVSYPSVNFFPNRPHLPLYGRLEFTKIEGEFSAYFLSLYISIKPFPHFFDWVFDLFRVKAVDFDVMF